MSMAMGQSPTADDIIHDERNARKELQARVRGLEDRVASLERIVNAILRVPVGDPLLDLPVL